MEREASACMLNPGACNFTPFDVSDFPLPPPKPPHGTIAVPNWVGLIPLEVTTTGHNGQGSEPDIPSAPDVGLQTVFVNTNIPDPPPPGVPPSSEEVTSTVPPAGTLVRLNSIVVVNVTRDFE
jgi:hypothetical protein